MNINFKSPWLALVMCLAAASAQAQTYNMTFNGRVAIQPCTIAVDAVPMGDVPISEFIYSSTPGSVYGRNFDVRLQNCDIGTLSTATLKFSGVTAGSNSVLALTTGASAAKGIGVQITTNDSQHGNTGLPVKFDGSEGYNFNIASRRSSYTFRSSYIRAPNASTRTAGIANATATITLSYS